MYTLKELSVQYGLLAQNLYKRRRTARNEAARAKEPGEAYLLKRREALLREMWREARDTSHLLAHYYDASPCKRSVDPSSFMLEAEG